MKSSRFTVKKDLQGLTEAIIGIEKSLERNKTVSRKRMMASLLAEECIVKLSQVAKEGSDIIITTSNILRNNYINIISKGSEIDFTKVLSGADTSDLYDEYGVETVDAVRNMVLRSNARDISYRHFSDINVIRIKVQRGENMGLMDVLGAKRHHHTCGGIFLSGNNHSVAVYGGPCRAWCGDSLPKHAAGRGWRA